MYIWTEILFISVCWCLYITPTGSNNNSFKKIVPVCKKYTQHKESKLILEPPKYVIITVNRFKYKITSMRTGRMITLDLNIMHIRFLQI